ncbi:MAG TPA: ABC transporter permease [Candidatus Limnocylindrales bacterium]
MRFIVGHPLTRRLVESVLTLFGVAVLVFVMLRAIPGSQITATLGTEAAGLSAEQKATLESYYGLDKPLPVQFFSWLGNLFTGNLGFSRRANESVLSMTQSALPVTVELAVLALIVGLLIGLPLAMLSASRPNGVRDGVGQIVGLLALSIPNFLIGATLLTVVSKYLHYNPNAQRFAQLTEDPLLNLQQMLFPALVLGFGLAAPIMRTARASLLEVSNADFMRTARGKGVAPGRLRTRHLLHNALNPIVTMTGIQFGYLLGGAVVVEQIFSVPGIGRQVLVGMQQKEFAVVQSTVLVIAATFVVVNLLTDLAYRVIDPRVRAS